MCDIESRITKLEKSNRQLRRSLTICIGLFGMMSMYGFGQVGQNQQTFPRNIVADSITVQTLQAYSGTVNQLGSNNATLQFVSIADGRAEALSIKNGSVTNFEAQRSALGRATSSRLDVVDSRGNTGVSVSSTSAGGSLQVMDSESKIVGTISNRSGGGSLTLMGKNGFAGIDASVDDRAGMVKVLNSFGKSLVTLGRGEKGDGEVATCTRNGNRVVLLECDEMGKRGKLTIFREGALPVVKIDSDDKEGFIQIFDGKNETNRFPKN